MDQNYPYKQADALSRCSIVVNRYVPLPDTYFQQGASALKSQKIINAMTVDVEDYYQVSAFDSYIKRKDWANYSSRVEANVDRILSIFDETNVKGTFFTLGCVAQRHPGIAKRICAEGHELASHGWLHYRVREQSRKEFASDIRKTKHFLEDLTGSEVVGYRAASYSIDETTPWAHEELLAAGYLYSSSIVPINHDHYGIPHAPRFPFYVKPCGLLEIPVSTYRIGRSNKPCGGGGWFRLYPYAVSRHALKHINEVEAKPTVFYIHPWEIDPGQPRQKGISFKTRIRHYINLSSVESKLINLLGDFQWGRMDDIYLRNKPLYLGSNLYGNDVASAI